MFDDMTEIDDATRKNAYSLSLSVTLASLRMVKTIFMCAICSCGVPEKIPISSKYTRAKYRLMVNKMIFIIHTKVVVATFKPNSILVNSYKPWCKVGRFFFEEPYVLLFTNSHH